MLGLSVVKLDTEAQTIDVLMPFSTQTERKGDSGQTHGGAIAALIDTAGTFAIIACTGHGVPTINIRVDFTRPSINSDITASAKIRKLGRSVGIVDIDAHDENGKLVAVGRGTFGTSAG